jgi:hypothetical protein
MPAMQNAFWEGGHTEWWIGLWAERRRLQQALASAQTDEDRQLLSTQLEELDRQRREANQNGAKWLH